MHRLDLLIVGAGPVGLALALALRDSGLDVALADARNGDAIGDDPRVLALAHGTRLTLERLGVWTALRTTPIETIHVSQQGGFGRTLIRASEHDVPALGYVTSAGELARTLRSGVEQAGISIFEGTSVGDIVSGADDVTAVLRTVSGNGRSGHCRARLVACAEGGLKTGDKAVIEHHYDQHALISFVTARGGHGNVAFERFTAQGPVALLPCAERYAVVHVTAPAKAEQLVALDDASYLENLQRCFGTRVELCGATQRLRYPLDLRYRRHPIGPRTVWLGNAAQTLHPVAGQGFNLALRDVWALADTLLHHPGDPGRRETLAAYASSRKLDRFGTIHFTDALVRLFSNHLAPLRHLRGAGLFALDLLPPLHAFVARRMMFGARAWP